MIAEIFLECATQILRVYPIFSFDCYKFILSPLGNDVAGGLTDERRTIRMTNEVNRVLSFQGIRVAGGLNDEKSERQKTAGRYIKTRLFALTGKGSKGKDEEWRTLEKPNRLNDEMRAGLFL